MPSLTRKDVEEIALLARLHLEADELAHMETDLAAILGHCEALAALDTADVPPMVHAVPMDLRLRADEVGPSLSEADALRGAPKVAHGQIVVPAILPGSGA